VLSADEAKLHEHAKFDGCYAIISDLPSERANAEQLHARYKDLAKVEADFRNMKHGHLEIRTWYVQTEDNTRAHALTAMLGLKIRRQLKSAWQPLNLTVEEGSTS
jgi:transposase